jgi:hypothetical protein
MSSPRPNLFLIGSMKSGTTHLSTLLGDHPAIFMSTPKEPCHFADGNALRTVWPYMWKRGFWQSTDLYLSLFAGAGEARVIGEASTVYSHAPIFKGVPQKIRAFNADARFIYIMRDPVERSISHYWHRVRWWGERRPILTAIRSEPLYIDVSHYARQLREYLQHIGRERIYVLTHEALIADPVNQLSRLYAWLKVDPSFRPSRIDVPSNKRPEVVYQVRYEPLEKFRRSALYGRVAPYVPESARRFGYALALRSIRPADVPLGEAQDFLRSLQQGQTEELKALLNRDFPEWITLRGERAESEPQRARVSSSRYY